MKRDKFSVGLRNRLSECWMDCDSAAFIDGSKATGYEREELKRLLRKAVEFIDSRIGFI